MLKKLLKYLLVLVATYFIVTMTLTVITKQEGAGELRFDMESIAGQFKENMNTIAERSNLTYILERKNTITKEEAVEEVYKSIANREKTLSFTYQSEYQKEVDISEDVKSIVSAALKKDDKKNSSDYDYLEHIFNYSFTGKYILSTATINFEFEYLESKEETESVDSKIKKALKEMKIDSLDDYDKIKKIHDYIVNNSSYDLKYKNYTAYDVLFEGTAVCQGYALLTYKMMLEAGIPCRIISGTAGGESHAWNIVKWNKKWYNIDCTWDDPVTNTGEQILVYDYFMKNEKDFSDHIRDKKYTKKAFLKKYPMAEKSIKEKSKY